MSCGYRAFWICSLLLLAGCTKSPSVDTERAARGTEGPAPVISLQASPQSVPVGQRVQLTWSVQHADRCQASGGWSGDRPTAGFEDSIALTQPSTFSLSCWGPGGGALMSVNVAVTDASTPQLSFSASQTQIGSGESVTLNWSTQNLSSCTASGLPGAWEGSRALNGQQQIGPLQSSQNLTLSCTGSNGNRSHSLTISVDDSPVVQLSASPQGVARGGSAVLNWTSSRADSCQASGGWGGSRPISGSFEVTNITEDLTFILQCQGAGGTAVAMTTVSLREARLSWQRPTQNMDGTPLDLGQLREYILHWGTQPGLYPSSVVIPAVDGVNPVTSFDLGLPAAGVYYFTIQVITTDDLISAYSNVVTKVVY